MYNARYINPLKQFGRLNVELILTDPEEILPDYRQWMKFPDDVTDEQMLEAATNVIAGLTQGEGGEVLEEENQLNQIGSSLLSQIEIDKPGIGTVNFIKENGDINL